jgi:hypothetical protein
MAELLEGESGGRLWAGEFEGTPWFAMEFVEGRNLSEMVRQGPFEPADDARCVSGLRAPSTLPISMMIREAP